jgi:hypothetical protein
MSILVVRNASGTWQGPAQTSNPPGETSFWDTFSVLKFINILGLSELGSALDGIFKRPNVLLSGFHSTVHVKPAQERSDVADRTADDLVTCAYKLNPSCVPRKRRNIIRVYWAPTRRSPRFLLSN